MSDSFLSSSWRTVRTSYCQATSWQGRYEVRQLEKLIREATCRVFGWKDASSVYLAMTSVCRFDTGWSPQESVVLLGNNDGAKSGIAGDEQADLVNHGGSDKAVLAYASKHYETWNAEFAGMNFEAGGFGENLTVADIDESTCCIGDTFCIGDCLLQISQPRQPCWKLSGRWNLPKLAVLVQQNGRTGWYYRVLKEGVIEAGMNMVLVDRPYPEFSVAWAHLVMYAKPRRQEDDRRLAECPALSESWRTNLEHRAR